MILDIYEDKKDRCTKIVCIFLKHLKGNCADVHHSPFLSVFSGHVAIKKTCVCHVFIYLFTDLSCVFCFIFVYEIHQEEPERQKGNMVRKYIIHSKFVFMRARGVK